MNAGVFSGLGTFGQQGNTVVAAHSEAVDGSPDLFFNLDSVQIGNQIVINAAGQQLVYNVTAIYRAEENDLSSLYPTQDERLTLITCDRSSYNHSTGTYSQRVVVIAQRIV
jgi:LPXTG-site transpeptidase (sortase) family protein